MTILGAMECAGFGLFAADSGRWSPKFQTTGDKIQRCQEPPLAWAFAGNEVVGQPFNRWMAGRAADGWRDWDHAQFEIKTELDRLNGERAIALRTAAGKPDLQLSPNEFTSVLVAGWLGGAGRVFEILEVTSRGDETRWGFQRYHFSGSGGEFAPWVIEGIKRVKGKFDLTPQGLWEAIEPIAKHGSFSAGPVRMVKITPSGVEDIKITSLGVVGIK